MPIVVDRRRDMSAGQLLSESRPRPQEMDRVDLDYNYPRDMDIRPGSDIHEKLRQLVLERAIESHDVMQGRYDSWREIDKTLTAYIPPEQKTSSKSGRNKKQNATRIIIPMSFATLETLLTYMTAAFLQDPVFRFRHTGPEDAVGAALLELVVQQNVFQGKIGVKIHTMLRDAFTYGFGAVSPQWKVEKAKRRVLRKRGFLSAFAGMIEGNEEELTEDYTVYEGNELENIDPYHYLPDVNVPINEPQKGEYIGWLQRTSRMQLMKQERDTDFVFNAKYLEYLADGRSGYFNVEEGKRADEQDGSGKERVYHSEPVDVIHEYIDLVPAEHGLGDSEYPETWLLSLAGDEVIITAEPLGFDHGQKPVCVASPDYDGYSSTPVSRLEIGYGMQNTLDWLLSSHITNVKKAINDMFVADPSIVNIYDLMNPNPGKIIRIRPSKWGRGVKDAVEQLNVGDVTQGHISDAGFMIDMLQRVTGAADNVQGIVQNKGSRVSASEARGARVSALSRLEKAARIISMQSMQDIGFQMASNIQQLMSEETFVQITGRNEERLRKEYGDTEGAMVGPDDLLVGYDVLPHDGTMPGSESGELWIQLFQSLVQSGVAENFDMLRVFKHVARQLGARNVDDFVRDGGASAEVMDDETVIEEARKGNLVPRENGAS